MKEIDNDLFSRKFCGHCGTELPVDNGNYCWGCNTYLFSDVAMCPYCMFPVLKLSQNRYNIGFVCSNFCCPSYQVQKEGTKRIDIYSQNHLLVRFIYNEYVYTPQGEYSFVVEFSHYLLKNRFSDLKFNLPVVYYRDTVFRKYSSSFKKTIRKQLLPLQINL